jgi:hypothetical protein
MPPLLIAISIVVLAILIWAVINHYESQKKKRISSQPGNTNIISDLLVMPRPPAVSASVENKIEWVMKCSAIMDNALARITKGNLMLTKDSIKSTSDNIRLLAYHYEELASLGGLKESMYEHGKVEINYSRGGKISKAVLTYLWEFFCCANDLIYSDPGFREWAKCEDIQKCDSLIQLRILLIILINSYEADR